MLTFQEFIKKLSIFWEEQGCVIHQGYDLEVGAGTFNPATFLRCLGPEPYNAAYAEPSRRPKDGRYGKNPNRLQHYFQYQVILKPSPDNIQDLYLKSLENVGIDLKKHDIRFVHDDWEAPTLGAWGLGWEVWLDGMEVTQFTYFQSLGGLPLKPITGEITYGPERLAMYLQKTDNIFDLQWNDSMTYGDIYRQNEVEWSQYNFEQADANMWRRHFEDFESEATRLIENKLPLPAYDFVMKASHAFNILDARGTVSVTERTGYIARIRKLSCMIAESYVKSRERLSFPLIGEQKEEKTLLKELSTATAFVPMGCKNLEKSLQKKINFSFDCDKKNDFILEIGSEELPAAFIPIGCKNLEKSLQTTLDQEGISYDKVQALGTPRRLAIYVSLLAEGKKSICQERKGPPVNAAFDKDGNPTQAGLGFLRSLSLSDAISSLDEIKNKKVPELSVRSLKNVDYLFAKVEIPSLATIKVLSEKLPQIIANLEFPKKMRWGNSNIAYARPIRWILALFGKEIVPFSIENINSSNQSFGHSQLSPGAFSISEAKDYFKKSKERMFMPQIEERKNHITKQLHSIEKESGLTAFEKEKIIPQVLHLVEWPMLTVATFDKDFLNAPKEVLISEMVEHQKYFPMLDKDGKLSNRFIITADNTPSEQIRKGNVKVISARLADGVFLYKQDLDTSLEKLNKKLKHLIFQKDVGSIYEKAERLAQYVENIHKYLNITDLKKAKRAALLSKSDLASELVGEFPNLQGVVGRLYALHQGEDREVAQAIDEHWMPRGENSPLPQSSSGILLSLSEKIDNLISCFSIGLKPTSSSDPYALRRQSLGIIKILIQGKYRLPLHSVLEACYQSFCQKIPKRTKESLPETKKILEEIKYFIANRIKTVFQDYGLKKDEIESSLSSGFNDIYDIFCRAKALHRFRRSDKFSLLYEVFKRAKGQLNKEKTGSFLKQHLKEKEEIDLYHKLNEIEDHLNLAIDDYDYDKAYELIAKIQPYLANFFDNVRILVDERTLRENRTALLERVFSLFGKLLDFEKIQEKKKE